MLIFISGIITNFFFQLYYLIVIKLLTPMHIFFLNLTYTFFLRTLASFYPMIEEGKNKEYDNDKDNEEIEQFISEILFIFGIISQIIVIFGLLVYLEIIELNCFNFNHDLRRNIIQRSIVEYEFNKVPRKSNNTAEEEEKNLEENN